MLRKQIFWRVSALLLMLIGSITLVLVIFSIHDHRQRTINSSLTLAVSLAGGIKRTILWDDLLSVTKTLEQTLKTEQDFKYAFVLRNGEIYTDTMNGNIPSELISGADQFPEKPYTWEFADSSGRIHIDYVVPVEGTCSILRMGMERRTIDRHVYPSIILIIIIGAAACLTGILATNRIAYHAIGEIRLLANALDYYRGGNSLTDGKSWESFSEIEQLADSFYLAVAERKADQARIRASLKEKEILLGEIYHRTHNNMQIISSLLSLQASRYSGISEIQDLVESTNEKIQVMSLVHQMICDSEDLSSVNIRHYIKELASIILSGRSNTDTEISLKIDIIDISLLMDTVAPLGLILNELLSNSLKYAFPESDTGKISITLARIESGKLLLVYSDNGVGVKSSFSFRDQATIGTSIIYALAEGQLGGTAEFKNREGLTCRIEFTDSYYSRRI